MNKLKKGVFVIDQFEQMMLIDDLVQIVARLPRRDNVLAGMLIKWFANRGTLSAEQEALGQAILFRNKELLNA